LFYVIFVVTDKDITDSCARFLTYTFEDANNKVITKSNKLYPIGALHEDTENKIVSFLTDLYQNLSWNKNIY
jgi:hypothetical protein